MVKISENFSLVSSNTFAINVVCRYHADCESVADLVFLLGECDRLGCRRYILGSGSNVIFAGDFDGMAIHMSGGKIEDCGDGLVVAWAGVQWDDLVSWSVERELAGLENLSLIPGTVGASPVQNIGAYGSEAGDHIQWVEYFDTSTMELKKIQGTQCRFGYRESIFKHQLKECAIITRVAFRLLSEPVLHCDYGDVREQAEALGGLSQKNIRQAIISIRTAKLPDPTVLPNAGSFFKNPVVTADALERVRGKHCDVRWFDLEGGAKKIPAGWLIEKAGWKGRRMGNVGVHERQALVIVNYGGATAAEILGFSELIQRDIADKFGITIDREVNVVE